MGREVSFFEEVPLCGQLSIHTTQQNEECDTGKLPTPVHPSRAEPMGFYGNAQLFLRERGRCRCREFHDQKVIQWFLVQSRRVPKEAKHCVPGK